MGCTSSSLTRRYASEYHHQENLYLPVQQDEWALQYASEDLRNDRMFVMKIVQKDGRALYCASEDLRNDRQVVLAAVKQNGLALYYASEDLLND